MQQASFDSCLLQNTVDESCSGILIAVTRDLKQFVRMGAVPNIMIAAASFFITMMLFQKFNEFGNLHGSSSLPSIIRNIAQ